jgi:hypothetical protein
MEKVEFGAKAKVKEGICTSGVWLLVFYKEPSILVFYKYFRIRGPLALVF